MTQSIFHNPSRQTREAPLHGRVRVPIRPGGHQARHAEDCRARDRSGQRHHTVKLAPDRQRRTRSSRHLAAFELPNGERREWTSRWARKGLGMRNADEPHRSGVLSWRPRTLSWWIAILFTLGSARCSSSVVPVPSRAGRQQSGSAAGVGDYKPREAGSRDSCRRGSEERGEVLVKRMTGLEPATSSLGSWRSTR